jgi:hypothetical protein
MRKARPVVAVLLLLAVAAPAAPAVASESSTELTESAMPIYSGLEFQALYSYAVTNTLPGLQLTTEVPSITGNSSVDDRIWARAIARGYKPQPMAIEGRMVSAPILMQPGAAEGWRTLNAEARQAGMGFIARSAYRSPATQRRMFNERMTGSSDSAIDAALRWAAPPGMSKHHGGYAIDFRYPDGTYGSFRSSPGYAWLARDNFAAAKRHGFVPSYPDDVENQGPNPEPWEFVWVGTDLIRCGIPQSLPAIAGPAGGMLSDIERCPGGPGEAEVPAWIEALGKYRPPLP